MFGSKELRLSATITMEEPSSTALCVAVQKLLDESIAKGTFNRVLVELERKVASGVQI